MKKETSRLATVHEITMPGGRVLGYSCFGAPSGQPVIYCHGFPASRLEAGLLDCAATEAGIRLIAPDRPGFGSSTFLPDRTIVDWSRDVGLLADRLGLERFRIVGGSAGCPYALACAREMPDRVLRAAVVAGLAPAHDPGAAVEMSGPARLGFRLARNRPLLFRIAYGLLARIVRRQPGLVYRLNQATPPDRAVLALPEVRRVLDASVEEALRPGVAGALRELELLAKPWGFALDAVSVPIDIWHGDRDGVVPPEMGRTLAARLPRARHHSVAGEGHVSLVIRHGKEILTALRAPA